jgi:hypothetical protein
MKFKNSIITIILLCLSLAFLGESCDDKSTDSKERDQQEQILAEGNRQVGMPNIVHFREKKELKTILEMRDDANLICYCYCFSDYNGKYIFIGKCIGYPLPYATQFTNPQKPIYRNGVSTISQADPNGLFSPSSAEATWILLIDEKTGNTSPFYCEPKVAVFTQPLPDRIVMNK